MNRALVLGAGGFLGSHLTHRLVTDGWEVKALVRDARAAHVVDRLGYLSGHAQLVEGDARDSDLLALAVRDVNVIFPLIGHLPHNSRETTAAWSMKPQNARLSIATDAELAVLEAVRHHNPSARIVFAGSRLQYGLSHGLPVNESHIQAPRSPYGAHKAVCERYYILYRDLYGLSISALRIANPYGAAQLSDKPHAGSVARFMRLALEDVEIPLFGGGHQTRDYIFIDDLVSLFVLAGTKSEAMGKTFNAGSGIPTTVRELGQAVIDVIGKGRLADVGWPPSEAAVDTGDFVCDITRAREELEWTPTVDLRDGLRRTLEGVMGSSRDPTFPGRRMSLRPSRGTALVNKLEATNHVTAPSG
jgi:UDP-glucose 4-epimerase